MSLCRTVTVVAVLVGVGLLNVPRAEAQEKKDPDKTVTKQPDAPVKDKAGTAQDEKAPLKDKAVAEKTEATIKGKEDPATDKGAGTKVKDGAHKDAGAPVKEKSAGRAIKKATEAKTEGASRDKADLFEKTKDGASKGAIPAQKDKAAAGKDKTAAAVKEQASAEKVKDAPVKDQAAVAKAKEGADKGRTSVKGTVNRIDVEAKSITLSVPAQKDAKSTEQTFSFAPELRVMLLGQDGATLADIQSGMPVAVILNEDKTVMGIKAVVKDGKHGAAKDVPAATHKDTAK